MTALRPKDVFLAVLVVFVFGVSFVAVKLALQSMPPFALCAWRFFLAAFPLVLLLPRPKACSRRPARYSLRSSRQLGRWGPVADCDGVWRNGVRFGLWARLLSTRPAAQIAPFALPIPVFGMGSTALAFGERLTPWQTVGVVLVIGGLALVVFGPRVERGFLRSRR